MEATTSSCALCINDVHAAVRELLLEQIVRDVRALREIERGEVADDGTPGSQFYAERIRRNREELMGMTGGTE